MTIIQAIDNLKHQLSRARTHGDESRDEIKSIEVAIGILYEYYASLPKDARDFIKF